MRRIRLFSAGLRRGMLALGVGFSLHSFFPSGAAAFGQNKVQYHPFDWSYYQSKHFDVYFPQGGEKVARFAAARIETLYEEVAQSVGHRLRDRVPVILYESHADFQQTNVIDMQLNEGIGGFTEIFKNRVVLPFEGSYKDFNHVLQHELVHAVMFDRMFGEGPAGVAGQMGGRMPLWLSEGLAEYTSLGWDLASEFFMIDATTFGYVAPPTMDFGGFLAYKGGQSFLHFVESVYGKGTVNRLLTEMEKQRDLPRAFQKVTRTSLEEAGEIWLRELRYLYWPELGRRQYGKTVARRLTEHGKDGSFYNLQPSLSPNGKEIAFFSDRESWEAVYIMDVKTEKVTRSVIQGGKEGRHESFHSFKSGIAWRPDSKALAIVSKSEGRDVLHVVDAKSGHVLKELSPPVEGILSPSWSRDGKSIAFSGLQDGFSDIYTVEVESGRTHRLTHDMAHDDKPAFSPSGRWIVFETDRPSADFKGDTLNWIHSYDSLLEFKDLYRIPAEGGSLQPIAVGPYDEKMPTFGKIDAELIFVSNRSGLDNLYLWRETAEGMDSKPITNLLTGCFTPSWSWDGDKVAFSLFEAGGWDLYLMSDPLSQVRDEPLPRTRFIDYLEDSTQGFYRPPNFSTLSSYKPDTTKSKGGDSAKPADKAGKTSDKAREGESVAGTENDSTQLSGNSKAEDSGVSKDSTASNASKQAAGKQDSALVQVAASEREEKKSKGSKKNGPFLSDSSLYWKDSGGFIRRDYKPTFSLDNVNAALGVDNYYGTAGQAFVTLSDLMGDQKISFALAVNGSIENTNGFLLYEYLPYKADFTVAAYHEAQQTGSSVLQVDSNAVFSRGALDRRYGVQAGIRYPFSPFTRLQFDLRTLFTERTFDTFEGEDEEDRPDAVRINAFFPSLSWVHDNTQWGIVGPVNGRRLMATAQAVPPFAPLFERNIGYVLGQADMRQYWEFFKRYTVALRVSAGASEALPGKENPHTFVVGGESFTFNAHFNEDNLPTTLRDFYFADLDFPLRGFDFYEFRGTRKVITNAEFRFPFLREMSIVWPIPISLRHVMGSIFLDYGGAWSRGNAFDQMGMGMGYGFRMNLGIFVLKYTWAKSLDLGVGRVIPTRVYWSLGAEF